MVLSDCDLAQRLAAYTRRLHALCFCVALEFRRSGEALGGHSKAKKAIDDMIAYIQNEGQSD